QLTTSAASTPPSRSSSRLWNGAGATRSAAPERSPRRDLGSPTTDAPLEDPLERHVDAGRERALDHRGLTDSRDLDAGSREGQPLLEITAHWLDQFGIGADAAAEHDEREVERRGEREDVERDATGRFLGDLRRDCVAGPGGREEISHLVRR